MMTTRPVLIVSRDARLQDELVEGLREQRVASLSADHHRGAVALIAEMRFRAIVFDVHQAVTAAACQEVAIAAHERGMPIVVLTTVPPNGQFSHRAFNGGCTAFLLKPCSAMELLRTLDRLEALIR